MLSTAERGTVGHYQVTNPKEPADWVIGGPQNLQGQEEDPHCPNKGKIHQMEVELRAKTTRGWNSQLTVVIYGLRNDLSKDELWLQPERGRSLKTK